MLKTQLPICMIFHSEVNMILFFLFFVFTQQLWKYHGISHYILHVCLSVCLSQFWRPYFLEFSLKVCEIYRKHSPFGMKQYYFFQSHLANFKVTYVKKKSKKISQISGFSLYSQESVWQEYPENWHADIDGLMQDWGIFSA